MDGNPVRSFPKTGFGGNRKASHKQEAAFGDIFVPQCNLNPNPNPDSIRLTAVCRDIWGFQVIAVHVPQDIL